MSQRIVRIGAGCSVDTTLAWGQMACHGEIDYFLADYLYEAGVAGFAADRNSNPDTGFPAEFVGPELEPWIKRLVEQKIKIITNAGALNPLGCGRALQALLDRNGLSARIAVIHGDNVLELLGAGHRDMFSGEPLPPNLVSANAYFGAKPVADALALGADIVITGRAVDSAMIVGPLMHEFGWSWDDYDKLGAATLVGHLLECGPQPSGGIHTDWREVDFANMSFPIAECTADGEAILTKVPGTGGIVTVGTISEQILYEIGDPQRYYMPEVTCDLSQARAEQVGPDRVRVWGARGRAPTATYKTCCMQQPGWRSTISGLISGPDALEKAERTTAAVIKRLERLSEIAGYGPFIGSSIELIGSGASQGARAPDASQAREIVYRIVADHADRRAVEPLVRIARASMVSMAPGTAGLLGSATVPLMKMYSVLLDKAKVPVWITLGGVTERLNVPTIGGFDSPACPPIPSIPSASDGTVEVQLVALAWTRSGDKGNLSNIGVIARQPEFLPYLKAALNPQAVAQWFAHLYADPTTAHITSYDLPGLNALNLMLHDALVGGAVSSRRFDSMGKGLGQQIIDFPVRVPQAMATKLGG